MVFFKLNIMIRLTSVLRAPYFQKYGQWKFEDSLIYISFSNFKTVSKHVLKFSFSRTSCVSGIGHLFSKCKSMGYDPELDRKFNFVPIYLIVAYLNYLKWFCYILGNIKQFV